MKIKPKLKQCGEVFYPYAVVAWKLEQNVPFLSG